MKHLNICQFNPIESSWQSNVSRNANWPKKRWDGQAKRGEGGTSTQDLEFDFKFGDQFFDKEANRQKKRRDGRGTGERGSQD